MPRFSGAILLALGVAAGAAGGYWYARLPARAPASAVALESIATAAERKILYYRDPSGPPYFSAEPRKLRACDSKSLPVGSKVDT